MDRHARCALCALLMMLIMASQSLAFDGLERSEVRDLAANVIEVADSRPIIIGEERTASRRPRLDPASGRTYPITLSVWIADNDRYYLRFRVSASGEDMAALAGRAARVVGRFWAMADKRQGRLNARLRAATLDVWLNRDGNGGGEQSRNSIYVYDVYGIPTGLEWERTLAHELGHYLLLGPSGYTEPESWSNGLLGERLFLGWLRDDLQSGALKPSDLIFASRDEIFDYCAKQTDALVDRIRRRGPDRALLRATTRGGMDEATALLLYIPATHGPKALQQLLFYLPAMRTAEPTAVEFLKAYELWADRETEYSLTALCSDPIMVYMPAGPGRLFSSPPSLQTIEVEGATVKRLGEGSWLVHPATAGWRRIRLKCRGEADDEVITLKVQRKVAPR